ncbi:MAG: heavy metal-binding domain-containing protein [Bacteroidales bacterium]|nr:heavy metal-binding domain-containing protein [Bacteroidales bacterium]MBS3774359.1 heavy metal-binding domain-containing protein [Bacteroidales bacterium]
MIITNTEHIARKEVMETLGLVRGNSTRARFFGRDIVAFFKNIAGGEISEYNDLLSNTRNIAIERMAKEAEKMGADAVMNIRFNTANVAQGVSEILAYGTAVKLKDIE